jgi:hypothetical protein
MPGSLGTRREASVKNRSGSKNNTSRDGVVMCDGEAIKNRSHQLSMIEVAIMKI